MMFKAAKAATFLVLAALLSGCATNEYADDGRGSKPIPSRLLSMMSEKSMSPSAPVVVRIFKQESELEVWKKDRSGRFALLKTYPICRWSGKLGPKRKQAGIDVIEAFRRLFLVGLLCADRRGGGGNLRGGARGAEWRAVRLPGPGLPVPHDAGEHGKAPA
jgi:hypothetical protein